MKDSKGVSNGPQELPLPNPYVAWHFSPISNKLQIALTYSRHHGTSPNTSSNKQELLRRSPILNCSDPSIESFHESAPKILLTINSWIDEASPI